MRSTNLGFHTTFIEERLYENDFNLKWRAFQFERKGQLGIKVIIAYCFIKLLNIFFELLL